MNDLVGRRVACICCSDFFDPIPEGTKGTIRLVDSLGTVHVAWDNGRSLGMVPGKDSYKFIS